MLRASFTFALLVCCALAHAVTPTGGAVLPGSEPEPVTLGVYIDSVHGFNFSDGTFRVSGYMWWKFKSKEFNPLAAMQIINARDVRVLQPAQQVFPDGRRYASVPFFATINQHLDAAAYPFDRHPLQIHIETWYPAKELTLVPDTTESKLGNEVFSPGWRVSDLRVSAKPYTYPTNFGYVSQSDQTYSRATIELTARRESSGLVFDAFIGFFVCGLLCLAGYLVNPALLGPRTTLIASATFAAMSNKYLINSQIDSSVRSLLADRVALGAFLMIGALLATSAWCERLIEAGRTGQAARVNRLAFYCVLALYIAGNLLAFALALFK